MDAFHLRLKMKVLIYGEFPRGSGAWCYAESLREMGCGVFEFRNDEGLELYEKNQLARIYRRVRGVLEIHRRQHIRSLVEFAERIQPELVIILKGLLIGREDVQMMRRRSQWVVNINHDDFFSHNPNNRSMLQRTALPHYDYVFTTREVNVDEVRRLNPSVEFFPFAYYPRIHRPVSIPPEEHGKWSSDVVFIGTWEQERCKLLETLVRRVRCRYAIWGTQWNKAGKWSPLKEFIRGREAVMDEMAKVIGGAKVALAFLRKENRDDYTQRTFEIPACGGVLLGERTRRHLEFFREGEEAEFFDHNSPDEMVAKVQMLLTNNDHRENVRATGRAALLRQPHTYRDRMERVLELYNKHRRPIR